MRREGNIEDDIDYIMQLSNAYWKSCVLFTALQLKVFDTLGDGELSAGELCTRLELDQRCGAIFLNACASLGLLHKKDNRFSASEAAARCLRQDSPVPLRESIFYNIMNYDTWGKLPETVKSGSPARPEEAHLGSDPERTRTFVHSMHSKALSLAPIVLQHIPLDNACSLLDVAGCAGTYSYLARQRNPQLQATVFDLEEVTQEGSRLISELDTGIRFMAGDYRQDTFPMGFDRVLLFGMLHQETPESARQLLTKACRSLNEEGRCYILDIMLDADRTSPQFAALFSVNMTLTHSTGGVFSSEDLETWATKAGFVSAREIPLPSFMPYKLIELNAAR